MVGICRHTGDRHFLLDQSQILIRDTTGDDEEGNTTRPVHLLAAYLLLWRVRLDPRAEREIQ